MFNDDGNSERLSRNAYLKRYHGGSRTNFQNSYGLKMTEDDVVEGTSILDNLIEHEYEARVGGSVESDDEDDGGTQGDEEPGKHGSEGTAYTNYEGERHDKNDAGDQDEVGEQEEVSEGEESRGDEDDCDGGEYDDDGGYDDL